MLKTVRAVTAAAPAAKAAAHVMTGRKNHQPSLEIIIVTFDEWRLITVVGVRNQIWASFSGRRRIEIGDGLA